MSAALAGLSQDAKQPAVNVLFFSLVFAPDGVSTAHVMADLAEDLSASGHFVEVVTTSPHQAVDPEAEQAQPRAPVWGPFLTESRYKGIRVLHALTPRPARTWSRRIVAWFSFHFVGFMAAVLITRRPQVIIVPSPLISAGIVAWLVTLVRGGKVVYNVQELYPDLAVRMGFLTSPLLIRIIESCAGFLYRRSWALTPIAESMRRALIAKGVPPAKVRYVPNFVDLSAIVPLPRANLFAQEHELTTKFVVSYAGNMGRAQGLDRVIEAARILQQERNICFLFVGEGSARNQLVGLAEAHALPNVLFLHQQPFARVPEIYASSDVCIVAIVDSIAAEAVPSKVYRILAAERPVLALTSLNGELGRLIADSNGGIVVDPATPESIANGIRQLLSDDDARRRMGAAGRAFVAKKYSRELVSAEYRKIVDEAVRA